METIEAAEALLNMESPNNILDEKRMRELLSAPLAGFKKESATVRITFSQLWCVCEALHFQSLLSESLY